MSIQEFIHEFFRWVPANYAESYDNIGLLLGNPDSKLSKVLINLDVTEKVIEEAVEFGANLILVHHPFWFFNRKNLAVGDSSIDFTGRIAMKALQANVAIAAAHTNLDRHPQGVNKKIAQKLGLNHLEILKPSPQFAGNSIDGIEVGAGMVGDLPEPMPKFEFMQKVKSTFGCGGIRFADSYHTHISKVAVGGGACKEMYTDALRKKAHAYLTSDISYHFFFEPMGNLLFMDLGHYEIEQFTTELIFEQLSKLFPNFAVENRIIQSKINTNSVSYF